MHRPWLPMVLVALAGCRPAPPPPAPAPPRPRAGGAPAAPRCATATASPVSTDPDVIALARAAAAFQAALDPMQRDEASFCLEDDELVSWSNLPLFLAPRRGVAFAALTARQAALADAMIDAFLSRAGRQRIDFILDAEEQLRATDGDDFGRGLYHLSLFNQPGVDGAWGVQLDGHHLALTIVVDGDDVAMTPAFFGAQPNRLRGVAAFAAEETLAYDFVAALGDPRLAAARIAATAPEDIETAPGEGGPDAFADDDLARFAGVGLGAAAMTATERQALRALLAQVVSYQDTRWAAATMREVDRAMAQTWFAWSGPTDGRGRFYFRIYSPALLVEYDLTANRGGATDHTHMIVRTPGGGDYGRFGPRPPTLEQHLRREPHDRGAAVRELPTDEDVAADLARRLRAVLPADVAPVTARRPRQSLAPGALRVLSGP